MNDRAPYIQESDEWLRRREDRTDRLWGIGLLIAALVLLTLNLGELPLRDWDEGLVAQVAKEIWQAPNSTTWLYPTLWGDPYINKPPLMHWLIAGAYSIGGVNEWTARLPGALLTASSVPLLYAIGREVFYSRPAALFAALAYVTSLPVVRQGRLAMLDGAILCFLLLLMLCVLRTRRDHRYALGVGLSLGLICLTKGLMVAVLMGTIAAVFLFWDTPRLLSSVSLWTGVLLGTAPATAWYVAQGLHYGQSFFDTNLVDQSLQRVWADVEANGGAPWYYLLELVKYGFPWLLFWPLGGKLAWEHRNLSWARLTLIWGGVYLLAISLMATKLPWYSLPLYPVLALLTGVALAQLWNRGSRAGATSIVLYSPRWMWIFALLAIGTWAGSLYFGRWSQPVEPDLQLLFGCLALTLSIVTLLVAQQQPQFLTVLIWGTYVALGLFVLSDHWVWELAEAYPVKPVAAVIQKAVPAGAEVYTSYPHHRPSLNFYSDRPVQPVPIERIRRLWTRQQPTYFVLDDAVLRLPELQPQKVAGRAAGWTVVSNQK